MLDPALCDRPPMPWLGLKMRLLEYFSDPILMIPVLGLLILLPWLIRRWRWKRVSSLILAIPLLVYLIAPLDPVVRLAQKGLTHWLPPDPGQPADAIVLLGRGADLGRVRVEDAYQLWQAGRSPLIFSSGNGDGTPMMRQLQAKGIPSTQLQAEDCSQTTEENAQFTAMLLQPQGVKSIILVTDPPHMLRSWLTFRSLGFTVFPHLSRSINVHKVGVLEVYREYFGLVSYGLTFRFLPRTISQLTDPMPPTTDPLG